MDNVITLGSRPKYWQKKFDLSNTQAAIGAEVFAKIDERIFKYAGEKFNDKTVEQIAEDLMELFAEVDKEYGTDFCSYYGQQ